MVIRTSFLKCVFAGILLLSSGMAYASAPVGYQLVMSEDFESPVLDQRRWSVKTDVRDNAVQTLDAVSIKDGILSIRTYTENGIHKTGFITTRDKFESLYGYYEARIKFNGASGEWCAFWLQSATIGNPIGDPTTAGVEVDVVEHRVVDENQKNISQMAVMNLHWDGYQKDHKRIGSSEKPSVGSLNNEWHTYAVLWTPDSYKLYLDGVEQWSTASPVSHHPEHIRLTCEVRDHSWAGPIPAAGYGNLGQLQVGMDVDWVRVWAKPSDTSVKKNP